MSIKLILEKLFIKYSMFNDNQEIDSISLAINDIKESSEEIVLIINSISMDKSKEEIIDLLFDLKDELNHIVYHLNDSKFLDYSDYHNEIHNRE